MRGIRITSCAWTPLVLLGAALLGAPATLVAQQLAAGDTLHIRLLDAVHSHHRAHPRVRAVIITPLIDARGRIVVPPGSTLSGQVSGSGMERFGGKRHWLSLTLDSIAVPMDDGTSDSLHASIALRIAAIDDAREIVDSAGRIVGPPIPSLIAWKRDWALVLLSVVHPIDAVVLEAVLKGEIAERHRAISFNAGRELTATVSATTTLARWTTWKSPPPLGPVADSIAALAPLRASLPEGNAPSDIIELAVIGTASQMHDAFAAAGWSRATPSSVRGDLVTFARAAKGEGYEAQPVSELLLGERPPDEVYEKVADTFTRRHHFRVWSWPAGDDGTHRLWLIAATHDTGLMFSRKGHPFTHSVDPRIDLERDKIVSDLVAADRVSALSYVSRTVPPGEATVNGGRTPVVTDWRMAVIALK